MQDLQTPEWDIDSEYPGLDSLALQQDRDKVKACVNELKALSAGLEGDDPLPTAQRMAVIQKQAQLLLYNLISYAYLKRSTNIKNHDARELLDGLRKLGVRLDQALQPLEQYLLRADDETFGRFLAAPELADSDFYYAQLRHTGARLLPLEQENLLSGLEMDGFQAWSTLYTNLTGSIDYVLKGEDDQPETVGVARLLALLGDRSDLMRRRAWEGLNEVFETHQEACAAILNAMAGWRLELCERRSHTAPTHFLDGPLHLNRMQRGSLDAMMGVVKERKALGQQAFDQMARVLGKPKLDPWDSQAPAPDDGSAQLLNFNQAMDLIVDAFSEVDPSMGEFARMMQQKHWIDAAPLAHKAPGAFCSGFLKSRTPRVLMTYLGSQANLITLAHELGHAFHSWVMRDMPVRQTRYPMSLAETASTFAETVVRDYLLRHSRNPQEKLAILWQEVASIPRFTLNLPVRYEFERRFYEARPGYYFTPEDLRSLMRETWNDWHGESVSAADEMFWATKLHFYISEPSFYNFPYTFGYLFSQGIYAERAKRGEGFFGFYTELLRDTGRMDVEQLVQKHFGTSPQDPAFWTGCFSILEGYLKDFETLTAK
ncbi:MAG: oligoendopeptidase F [Candidatus Melainabacteria bacterium HGW-Melainabacteria-1]|nr:MAG: oligoendopeptidase F [Candidatus Melainabacteria bacterium HGW-Melainabacteria-1]